MLGNSFMTLEQGGLTLYQAFDNVAVYQLTPQALDDTRPSLELN